MKTIAVFAIIFGCFAVLYPKIFHPILSNMFGATPAHHVDDDMCKGICVLSTSFKFLVYIIFLILDHSVASH